MGTVYVEPPLAISVRQPWAWAIIHAGKDIENRGWGPSNPGLKVRGPVCIHAAKGMTRIEYETARDFMAIIGVECPAPVDLLRSGILGAVEVVDVVKESDSPWFFGPNGIVLANPVPLDFTPVAGQLGFFEWRWRPRVNVPEPAKWMKAEFSVEKTQRCLI